jgi:protein tyrosine/serine phosphatase
MVSPAIERRILLQGSYNFRDFGGLQTADGRTVRSRRLFRSDELHQLTPEDVEILAELGVASLLDLRTMNEVTTKRAALLFDRGVRHLHVPLQNEAALDREALKAIAQMPMEELYASFLDGRKEAIGNIFGLLAEESTYPAVVHCAAGKDRTGVVSAIVLRTLGVPDAEIVADYALTDEPMSKIAARLREDKRAQYPDLPPHLLRALPETMIGFLARIDARFGSHERFLADAGISESTVIRVRELLLKPQ